MTTPVYAQRGCRFRVDDASVNWLADENNNYSFPIDSNFRIRIEVENTNNANGSPPLQIWASRNGGAYAQVTGATTYIQASLSDNFADGADDSTDRLTTATSTFGSGILDETGAETVSIGKSTHAEVEFCLKITPSSSPDDYFDFRVYNNGNPLGGGYSYTIRMTAAAGASTINMGAVTLTGSAQTLNVIPGASGVNLDYVTLTSSTQTLIVSSQAPAQSVNLSYTNLVAQAQASSIEKGGVTIDLVTATLTGSAQALSLALGEAVVLVGYVTLAGSAQGLTVELAGAPRIIGMGYATLIATSQSLYVISLGAPMTVQMNYASLVAGAQSFDVIVVGIPLTIQIGVITLTAQAQSLTALTGALVVQMKSITLQASPQNFVLGLMVTILLNYATLVSTAGNVNILGIATRPPEVILSGSWEDEDMSGSWIDEELEASL